MANLDPCDKRCKLIFSFHLAFRLKTYLKKLELKTKHKEQKRKEPTKDNSLFLLSLFEYSKVKKQWSNKGKRMNKYIKYGLLVFLNHKSKYNENLVSKSCSNFYHKKTARLTFQLFDPSSERLVYMRVDHLCPLTKGFPHRNGNLLTEKTTQKESLEHLLNIRPPFFILQPAFTRTIQKTKNAIIQ